MDIKSLVDEKEYLFAGIHVIGELYGIDGDCLNNIDLLEKTVSYGISASKVTCEGVLIKKFIPNGVTLLALLAESHISIHTYPENEALFFDAFTCGKNVDPQLILDSIVEHLHPKRQNIKKIHRGEWE